MSASSTALGLLAPLRAFGRAYNAQAQRRPMSTGLVTTVIKTSAADLFAQTVGGALSRCCPVACAAAHRARCRQWQDVEIHYSTQLSACGGAIAPVNAVTAASQSPAALRSPAQTSALESTRTRAGNGGHRVQGCGLEASRCVLLLWFLLPGEQPRFATTARRG
jgi:hypothetical protein